MSNTQSPRQALYRSHPRAYFLINTVMHQASDRDWEAITGPVDIVDENRLDRAIRTSILQADCRRLGLEEGEIEFERRYQQQHAFRFYRYEKIDATISPTMFVCQRCGFHTSLRKQIEQNTLQKQNLQCSSCRIPLKQVIHVFGHSYCGEIKEISSWNKRRCNKCRAPLGLFIDNLAFGRSKWRCSNGHPKPLMEWCPSCQGREGVEDTRMRPYAAAAAVKAVDLKMIDVDASADWEEVARRRLSISQESLRELLLSEYKDDPIVYPAILAQLNSSEETRWQMLEQFRQRNPELASRPDALKEAIGGEPDYETQLVLAEYAGTERAIEQTLRDPLDSQLRKLIFQRFRITPRYIANLPILQMVYGYQVGTSDINVAKIITFDRGWESVVLVHRLKTEAALFELEPDSLATWVSRQVGQNINKILLQTMLIRPESHALGTQIYDFVQQLIHTMAHLIIRQSELFTGLSRESLAEKIYTPAMAFAIYSADGSELGAIRSAFASYRLYEWLTQAFLASQECAHDPVCFKGEITSTAACHACLFIAERTCDSFWNEELDRRLVSNLQTNDGFWDE